ncbi:unnamed protein product [Callosobruchus maculatus]|uniref:C-type lectin domain-containing protein n=1 Tax=Callosobruchus maculatus TaxID=64391 RepID=A0A653D006_CALMS|nr:unnamed protein product [Callosobruchus maculatus]
MKLVSIESLEKSELLVAGLTQFLGDSQSMKFWTSGKRYGNTWIWDSTGYPARYTNWGPGQPSKKGRKKTCIEAVLNITAETLKWNNMDCSVANYFICESPVHSQVHYVEP